MVQNQSKVWRPIPESLSAAYQTGRSHEEPGSDAVHGHVDKRGELQQHGQRTWLHRPPSSWGFCGIFTSQQLHKGTLPLSFLRAIPKKKKKEYGADRKKKLTPSFIFFFSDPPQPFNNFFADPAPYILNGLKVISERFVFLRGGGEPPNNFFFRFTPCPPRWLMVDPLGTSYSQNMT